MSSSSQIPGPTEFQVLLALAGGQRHGYGIMQEVERSSGGAIRLGPGTLYGAIKRMLDAGWIEAIASDPNEDARRTHSYRLTRHGKKAAADAARQLADLVRLASERGLLPPASVIAMGR